MLKYKILDLSQKYNKNKLNRLKWIIKNYKKNNQNINKKQKCLKKIL